MTAHLQRLRRELHQHPELSGQEIETAKRIKAFIAKYYDTTILENLGGSHGLAAVYEFAKDGPTVVIRCELDALPIDEPNDFAYKSVHEGVSHKCGHDGHMAMVAGLIFWLREQQFPKGKVVLLFQPAEETGEGAALVLRDSRFRALQPDYFFALHNIPGYPLHSVIAVQNNFCATVQSVAIRLSGKESHSAQPEQGINPALCIAELIQQLNDLIINDVNDPNFTLFTPVYAQMGKKSYGISAGFGELHYTLRTWTVEQMEVLQQQIEQGVLATAQKHQLQVSLDWFDYFPTVINDAFCNSIITKAAQKYGLEIIEKPAPFRFGEDFGWFSQDYPVSMFGLGAGEHSPALHHADYDFPDALLESGTAMFREIITSILE